MRVPTGRVWRGQISVASPPRRVPRRVRPAFVAQKRPAMCTPRRTNADAIRCAIAHGDCPRHATGAPTLRAAAASTAMAAPLTLGVLLLLHLVSPIAGAGSTTAHHATVVIENRVAVVRVKEMAPMMLLPSTQAAFKRPWTTRGSGGVSLKRTLTHSSSDLSYISTHTQCGSPTR